MTFRKSFEAKLSQSLSNNFGKENYDEQRFGAFPKKKGIELFKDFVKQVTRYKSKGVKESLVELEKYYGKLEVIWKHLDSKSQNLLTDIIAYRILGYRNVKLPVNNPDYWQALEKVKTLKNSGDTINPNFLHFTLERFDLRPLGWDVELYFSDLGIVIDFILEQYAYKSNGVSIVQVEEGDTVLDIGGCWGDTALYFGSKAGKTGKVFSFEFIPGNIHIFNKNIEVNPALKQRINLIEHPVSNVTGQQIYYKDNGPGSYISNDKFEGYTGTTTTIKIDDFVKSNNISKVDFIKMDIEGAEPAALIGAEETIRKFKPKLAIAIYHGLNDLVNIPHWLIELNLDYDFYLGHYTIHDEETIIYGKPR